MPPDRHQVQNEGPAEDETRQDACHQNQRSKGRAASHRNQAITGLQSASPHG